MGNLKLCRSVRTKKTKHYTQVRYQSERETGATGGSKPTLLILELALLSACWSISPFQNKSLCPDSKDGTFLPVLLLCNFFNFLLYKIGSVKCSYLHLNKCLPLDAQLDKHMPSYVATSAFLTPNHFFQRCLWNCYVHVPVVATTNIKWCSSFLHLLVWL